MMLARVVGPVVSTIKHRAIAGQTVFVMQPVEVDGRDAGAEFLAVDHAQAGPGDLVVVLREGGGIRQILGSSDSSIRALIVGIVDNVERTAPDASAPDAGVPDASTADASTADASTADASTADASGAAG